MPGNAPPFTDERVGLLSYIAQQRDGVRYAAYGLTAEQLRATPTRSTLSVGGLLKHVTAMERSWMDTVLQRPTRTDGEQKYGADFQLTETETLADLIGDSRACARETEDVIAGLSLDDPVPVPDAPWYPDDVDAWSVRWVLLHLIEEIARHAGHADIIRESIDGASMYELMAGAEGWPQTPWITPWKPESPA